MSIPNTRDTTPAFISDPPDFGMPMSLEMIHTTVMSAARTENEQRSTRKALPKHTFQYSTGPLTTTEYALRKAKAILEMGAPLVVPIWTDPHTLASMTTYRATLTEDISKRRFKAGGYAYFTQPGFRSQIKAVTYVESDHFDFVNAGLIAGNYGNRQVWKTNNAERAWGTNLAAGSYRITYVNGALNPEGAGGLGWTLSNPNDAGWGVFFLHSGAWGTARTRVRFTGASGQPFGTDGEFEAANSGRYFDFTHTGGAIGIQHQTTPFTIDGEGANGPPTFNLAKIDASSAIQPVTYGAGATVYPCIFGLRTGNAADFSASRLDNTDETISVEEL